MNLEVIKRDPNFNNEEAIIKYRETLDDNIRESFIKNNTPYVKRLADKWFNPNRPVTYDDLLSLGFEGMLKAFNFYDPLRGAKCISFITTCIEREFSKEFNKLKYKGRSKYNIVSLQSEIKMDKVSGKEEGYLEEMVGDPMVLSVEEEAFNSDLINKFKYILETEFEERQKDIAYKFFIEGKSYGEIGNEVGLTRQRVHQIHKKIVEKLKQKMVA